MIGKCKGDLDCVFVCDCSIEFPVIDFCQLRLFDGLEGVDFRKAATYGPASAQNIGKNVQQLAR